MTRDVVTERASLEPSPRWQNRHITKKLNPVALNLAFTNADLRLFQKSGNERGGICWMSQPFHVLELASCKL